MGILLDDEGKAYVELSEMIFQGRQNIDWKAVGNYVKKYVGREYTVEEYGDQIRIGLEFAAEIKGSQDTKRLKGTNAKAKANCLVCLPELIENASNKRWQQNYKAKHASNAANGWNRYTTRFAFPVYDDRKQISRYNLYRIEVLCRIDSNGTSFIYDMVNTKKEGEMLPQKRKGS